MRLLVLSSYPDLDAFQEFQAARLLLLALAARGVEVELCRPWLPLPDLGGFDCALCWTYRHEPENFLFHAAEAAARCAAAGLPLVNHPRSFTPLHSHDLALWRAAGVPCAAHQRFTTPHQLQLAYPLILRRDSEHRGWRMYLAHNPAEAVAIWQRARRGRASTPIDKPLDLALEFVDVRWPDGFYRKRRAYVVGEEVIPAHSVRAEHWLVNFGHRTGNLGSYREDKEFLRDGEPRADLVRGAVAVLGADLAGVDYSPAPDGRYVFWEANRNPRMWGDRGLPAVKPRQADRRLAAALAELIERRAAARAG
jgi:hypothetical protein